MRLNQLLLVNLLLTVIVSNLSGQTELHSSSNGFSEGYSTSVQQLKAIDEDHFLLITNFADKNLLEKFTIDHKSVFRIELTKTGYYEIFEFLEASNEIFVVQYEPYTISGSEKLFRVWASFYDGSSGELKSRTELVSSVKNANGISFSENRSTFVVWTLDSPVYGKVYRTGDLNHLGDIHYEADEATSVLLDHAISNDGIAVLVHKMKETDIRFDFFDIRNNGRQETVLLPNELNKKVEMNYGKAKIAVAAGKTAYFVGIKTKKQRSLGLWSWQINFDEMSVKAHTSIAFDKTGLGENLYHREYPSSNLNNPETMAEPQNPKAPGSLKRIALEEVRLTDHENGDLILVMAHEYTKSKKRGDYYIDQFNGEEIYIVSIDAKGNTNWGTVIDRKVSYLEPALFSHPFRPGFSGITTGVHIDERDVQLVNFENKTFGKNATFIRKLDLKTGEMVQAAPLFNEKNIVINVNYIDWLTPTHLVCVAKLSASTEISNEIIRMKTVDLN